MSSTKKKPTIKKEEDDQEEETHAIKATTLPPTRAEMKAGK